VLARAEAIRFVHGLGVIPREAGGDRLYDRDKLKNLALHVSQELGPVRLGGFGYWGRERAEGRTDRILIWGPDATLSPARNVEVNLQYLRREDSNPLLAADGMSSVVNSTFGEVIVGPLGTEGRWYVTELYNWIDADRPLLSLRVGEQDTAAGFLQRYHTVSGGVHYLINRNVRLLGEARWDLEREKPRFTTGVTLAW
jgi:hypothetical protein